MQQGLLSRWHHRTPTRTRHYQSSLKNKAKQAKYYDGSVSRAVALDVLFCDGIGWTFALPPFTKNIKTTFAVIVRQEGFTRVLKLNSLT
jgi:hypothetical protein